MRRCLLIACLVGFSGVATAEEMAHVPGGTWAPLYPAEGEEQVEVQPFWIDTLPVTNAEYLAFVNTNEDWQRGKVPALFAGENYLVHWTGPTELGDHPSADPNFPVTNVTWWAARAYCAAQDARLPTIKEWELAAAASESAIDASKDPEFSEKILRWYSQPTRLHAVGTEAPNFYGLYDLHGLIWEWVEDFQSEIIVVDNRSDGTVDPSLFCGAGAVGAVRKEDYAAFMRSAFRSSLGATHATSSLGFRCARDEAPDTDGAP